MDICERLRNGARVRELNVTQEQIDQINQTKTRESWYTKKEAIRRIIGSSPCFSCSGIPSIELICKMKGAMRKESYCENCSLMLFQRDKDSPTDKRELADYYNLQLEEVTV